MDAFWWRVLEGRWQRADFREQMAEKEVAKKEVAKGRVVCLDNKKEKKKKKNNAHNK